MLLYLLLQRLVCYSSKLAQICKLDLIAGLAILFFATLNISHATQPAYYRYYDNAGVVTVSKSVTQQHIRRGYDVLDHNMNLIKHVPAYHVEKDLKQAPARAAQSRQQQQDLQLKRAYHNVSHAKQKKQESIGNIQKQLSQQYQQMHNLQIQRAQLLRQQAGYVRNGEKVSTEIKQKLELNHAYTQSVRQVIEQLKQNLIQQTQFYDNIIQRLQRLE
ncbi:hypothetical protein F4V57_11515 [Acinetobacter qingfengensis]|uniref:DUF4124 domain-containing protein n=1 Tax=Acinetobacter qingfengensis TaxID=1262585 RepID=A0A1E7RF34_9GAMM|nr:hypothetical protein [Acinetobacter qingfengensis]KAA8731867.1 hypothetical protein F4V57_11515 [Acinetobacter qingfengensis]OEY98010.1 hypothetical protein BJI46_00310 [Acinetobacter qingfengensis]